MTDEQKIAVEGHTAYLRGQKETDCPYAWTDELRRECWLRGWLRAAALPTVST